MKVLILTIILSISFAPEISAHLSDFVKELEFTQIPGSIEYNFVFQVDENNAYRGTTQTVLGFIYFIRDNNNILYWTIFTDEDRKINPVKKPVRLVEHIDDELHFENDHTRYAVRFNDTAGQLGVKAYATEWNLKDICFTKANPEDKTFHYVILSENNSRSYNDTTYIQKTNPAVQRIQLLDNTSATYQVKFTADELQSTTTFCKGISKVIFEGKKSNAKFFWLDFDRSSLKPLID